MCRISQEIESITLRMRTRSQRLTYFFPTTSITKSAE